MVRTRAQSTHRDVRIGYQSGPNPHRSRDPRGQPRRREPAHFGYPRRGVPLANRLAAKLAEIDPAFIIEERTGQLDITLYRDDLARSGSRVPASTIIPPVGVDDAGSYW